MEEFDRAAEELGVTHGAVSRQIGKLEQWIGQDLFSRQGRRLMLTPTGDLLASKVGHSLTDMMSACMDIAGSGRRHIVTIEAQATFAMYWLLPRVKDLEERTHDTEISLATRMTNQSYDGPLSDIVITRGPGLDRRLQSFDKFILMDEEMCLLAAPSFLQSAKISRARDVLHHQIVGTVTRPTDWSNWLNNAGLRGEHIRFRHLFDHLFVALHCVRDGIGTIVAPRNIFENEGAETMFRPVLPRISFKGQSYFVHYRTTARAGPIWKLVQLLREYSARSGRK
jgi:LysR family transcriptional regulator, glycine cleavage system transcriptional activator